MVSGHKETYVPITAYTSGRRCQKQKSMNMTKKSLQFKGAVATPCLKYQHEKKSSRKNSRTSQDITSPKGGGACCTIHQESKDWREMSQLTNPVSETAFFVLALPQSVIACQGKQTAYHPSHQPPTTSHQPPATDHRPPTTDHRSPAPYNQQQQPPIND